MNRLRWILLSSLALAACVPAPVLPREEGPVLTAHVEGAGPPLVLISGMACSGEVWSSTVEHLRGRYQVHVLQLAGFAGNKPIAGPYLTRVRDGVAQYLRAQHLEHPVIIGHSFGGVVALALAQAEPALPAAVVSIDGVPFAPALSEPTATPDSVGRRARLAQTLMSRVERGDAFAQVWRANASLMVTAPSELEKVLAWSRTSEPSEVALAMAELMTTDLRGGMSRIAAPLLLIGSRTLEAAVSGKGGPPLEDRYRAQLAGAPHARLEMPKAARHFVMLDDPGFLFAALDGFLASAGSPPGTGSSAGRGAVSGSIAGGQR